MDRLNNYILFLLFLVQIPVYCQVNNFDKIPAESVYIHTNTELLVTGETLLYKLYNFNTQTNNVSAISKIAYVMLVSDSKKIIFKHKLKLNAGQAKGDFFIPTSIETGNYKLVAYTNWMQNNKENPFFELDIYIINPFLKNKKPLKTKQRVTDSIVLKKKKRAFDFMHKVKTRAKVVIDIENIIKNTIKENITISVRKIDTVRVEKEKVDKQKNQKNTKFHLPEIRGEIFSGTVISRTENKAVENVIVALSISNNKIYRNIKTNKKGQFFFSINEAYKAGKLIVQILDANKENYKIVIDNNAFEYVDNLKFRDVYLSPEIKKWLLQKSIHHQIESSYIDSKKDSLEQQKTPISFYGIPNFTYKLDDYKRFGSVEETFVEVIQGAMIRKRKGKKTISVISDTKLDKVMLALEPLILMDGILMPNQEDLINYDVSKIKTMQFVSDVYFYGHKIYESILDIETNKGNYFPPASTVFSKKIKQMERNKIYYSPKYNETANQLDRIPDYRTQLLWLSEQTKNTKKIAFYTSDVKGVYEISIKGFSNKKEPIKIIRYLLVE